MTVRFKRTGGEITGMLMGKALIAMVHLMYQDKTAAHFLRGLYAEIVKEMKRRAINERASKTFDVRMAEEKPKRIRKNR